MNYKNTGLFSFLDSLGIIQSLIYFPVRQVDPVSDFTYGIST